MNRRNHRRKSQWPYKAVKYFLNNTRKNKKRNNINKVDFIKNKNCYSSKDFRKSKDKPHTWRIYFQNIYVTKNLIWNILKIYNSKLETNNLTEGVQGDFPGCGNVLCVFKWWLHGLHHLCIASHTSTKTK